MINERLKISEFTDKAVNTLFFPSIIWSQNLNSQAPDVPELAHHGILQLSRLNVNCYDKTVKKYPLHLDCADFMKILSGPQDHCGSHNYFLKNFSKKYTLYGVYTFLNFGIRLNRLAFNDTKTHFYMSEVVQK